MKETIRTKVIYTKLIHPKTKFPILLTGWREEIKRGKNKDKIEVLYYLSIHPAWFNDVWSANRFSLDGITISGGSDYKVGSLVGIAAFQRCVQDMLCSETSSDSEHKWSSDKDVDAAMKFISEHNCGIRCCNCAETGDIDVELVFGNQVFTMRWRTSKQSEISSKEIANYIFTIIKEVDLFFKKFPSSM